MLTRLVPFVQADSHAAIARRRLFLRRLPRRQLLPQARRPLPARDLHERRLRRAGQGGGERGEAVYFNNPMDYVANTNGDHLDWLRSRASLLLVCGQGQWEDTTGALDSTRRFAACSARRDPLRARPLGARRPSRLAVLAAADRTPRASIHMSDLTIGLLLGTEEDWPAAFEALVERLGPRRRDVAHRADPQRAVRPPLPATLLGRHRPARLVVRLAARVVEEGLADGRRLSAEQPVHVPGDGEALCVLRVDAARDPRAGDVADPAQGAARERALSSRPPSATTRRSTSSDRRHVGFPLFMKPFDGGQWVGVRASARPRSCARATTSRASG